MANIILTIPDEKVDEVMDALCDTEFEPATAQRSKEAILKWIKGQVLNARVSSSRQGINVDDLGLS